MQEWQDYLKNIKLGKMGYNKRELSKISCETIENKCVEFECNEDLFNKWLNQIK